MTPSLQHARRPYVFAVFISPPVTWFMYLLFGHFNVAFKTPCFNSVGPKGTETIVPSYFSFFGHLFPAYVDAIWALILFVVIFIVIYLVTHRANKPSAA